ncbi:hypothetical protein [Albimonas pacifica]|uniref:Uncharacterized protein n=1 Tax=Albimonas pacifica TaxID=1114924 RepID=A0A1I3BN58_9RHOB|nr:hypothetical protein [Albimonas pacifica]SFH63526.1 hypothetical protein SAMN05216258_101204 [Albimonas pacifica]
MNMLVPLAPVRDRDRERSRPRRGRPLRSRAAIGPRIAEVHDLTLIPMEDAASPLAAGLRAERTPTSVILVRPEQGDLAGEQLFIDHVPVPRESFRYDAHDRVLTWEGPHGGGRLHLTHDGTGGVGTVGSAEAVISVTAAATAVFDCDVAPDAGVAYVTSGGQAVALDWDPASPAWQAADWAGGKGRLRLTYTVTPGGPIAPPTFTFLFADKLTGDEWQAPLGSFDASLQLAEHDGQTVWALAFKSLAGPDPDTVQPDGTAPSGDQPDSVFPYWMMLREDAAALRLDGALEVDAIAPNGTLLGLRGERAWPAATGIYSRSARHAPFGVFGGRLHLGGEAVEASVLRGRELRWSGLDPEAAARAGLPTEGRMTFSADGGRARVGDDAVRRLPAETAHRAVERHAEAHPALHARFATLAETAAAAAASPLTIYGLLAMNGFVQNDKGQWSDAVQSAVTGDLGEIMNSFIPTDMWSLLFPGTPHPTVSGEVARIAASPVPGVADPGAWYGRMATAVMTQGLSSSTLSAAQQMNGPRAAQWLRTEIAASRVYNTHSQRLFEYRWQERFPLTADYLQDQIDRAPEYATIIDQQVAADIADIQANVTVDGNSPPDLKQTLIADVQQAGDYAKQQNLFWAFAFYTYNTAPAVLANIALQMGISTGSSDGMTLTRLFQQNAAVLTALDPSGVFSKKYTDTISAFLSTNIVPSMYSFENDSTTFDIIKQYLETFVQNNINNEDEQIREAAEKLATFLADENADQMLRDSIEALVGFSEAVDEALSFPYVAKTFVAWFSKTFPKFSTVSSIFGSVLMTGIAGLALFNLLGAFKQWDKLDAAQKTEVILNAVQMGIQFLAAVVKRGVRIYALYSAEGLTKWQRIGGISRVFAQGESDALEAALQRIGNTTARFLGDTEGSVGKFAEDVRPLLALEGEVEQAELSLAAKVFGRSLDEFVATRIGPLFILAGIGFSIYEIATGDQGVALASDILNIVSGALTIFATVGAWAIDVGFIAAESILAPIIAVAGPLAVLLALVGVGLLIYQMFRKPPDPVQEFVDDYVKPAGLAVSARASAVDYFVPFLNKDKNDLLMVGTTVAQGLTLLAGADGAAGLGAPTTLPDAVQQIETDGTGLSRVFTVVVEEGETYPVTRYLSLMDDGSIRYAPRLKPKADGDAPKAADGDGPKVVTQTWRFAAMGHAQLNSAGQPLSLACAIQVVRPPAPEGAAPADEALEFLVAGEGRLQFSPLPIPWLLAMSGMSPNYMHRPDISFVLNSRPAVQESYAPSFGVLPSTPWTAELSGDPLPAFLGFDAATGRIAPNGGTATPESRAAVHETVTNTLGSATVDFAVIVKAPATPS